MSPDIALDSTEVVVFDGRPLAADLVGGKGASLNRLVAAGVPVPSCGAVTTAAYREFARSPAIFALIDGIRSGQTVPAGEVDDVFDTVAFGSVTAKRIVALAESLGGGRPLAIRSSATVEDLDDSSFAGQYRSLLDIDPTDPVACLAAVRSVFASLWHPAPCAYRSAFGIDDSEVAMAAVLMRMVPAASAGVAFTVEPGGDPEFARVEAVDGLGESLVSGQRTPEAWAVPRALDTFDGPTEVGTAARLAFEIETDEGCPQDVEWAFDGETVWIVQARPITVTAEETDDGFDSPVDVAQLTTAGIGEMLPGVLPPFRWQIAAHLVNEAFAVLLDQLAASPGGGERRTPLVRRVRGRAALDFDALRELARLMPGGSVEELEVQYFGSQRSGRPTAPPANAVSRLSMVRHDLRSLVIRRRAELEAEIVVRAGSALALAGPVDLEALDSARLEAYQFRLIDLAVRATAAELAVAAAATSSYREIELLLARHLDAVDAGRWAEQATSARGIGVEPELSASAAVFAGPTWLELDRRPPSLGDRRGPATDAAAVEEALLASLEDTPTWGTSGLRYVMRRRALRHMIRETATLLRRREATKATLMQLGGEVRRTLFEQGRRLVDGALLDDVADVELMTVGEIRRAFQGQRVPPATINRRRRWRQRYEAEPPLPRVFTGQPVPEAVQLPPGGRLDGWAASPGRYSGVARVVSDPDDEFGAGEILVAAATDASWGPLFLEAGAIVVDRGGPLSHAAILARELGVPAVLNVDGASQMLDGCLLTVDGDVGIVVVRETPT